MGPAAAAAAGVGTGSSSRLERTRASAVPAARGAAVDSCSVTDYITPEQARRFYDRIGRGQDARPLSERRALDALEEQGDFARAAEVVEFGCGTGRFAARLLRERLPGGATYLGLDVSPRMVTLASAALAPWADRARVLRTDGAIGLPVPDGSADRVVSTYVLDLLSPEDAAAFVAEAHRVLRPGGALAVASLAPRAAGAPRHPSLGDPPGG